MVGKGSKSERGESDGVLESDRGAAVVRLLAKKRGHRDCVDVLEKVCLPLSSSHPWLLCALRCVPCTVCCVLCAVYRVLCVVCVPYNFHCAVVLPSCAHSCTRYRVHTLPALPPL
jgi:hypothetical protein